MKPLRIAALCALVFATATLASVALAGQGKNSRYHGNLSQPPLDEFSPQPTLDLYVHTQKHRDGSVVVKVTNVVVNDAHYHCQDGNDWAPGSTGGNRSSLFFVGQFRLNKKRAFSRSLFEESAEVTAKLTGKIPQHAAASGTLRLTQNVGPPLGFCDSGVLTWSAAQK